MKVFNNLEEMKPYYNKETNTYEFIENNRLIDIKIDFDLYITSHIYARGINVNNIKAWNINARNIKSWDIKAFDIKACDINALDINSRDINASNINASNINALNINARNINALDIRAENINANNIRYNSVCYARQKFVCNSIKGTRPNSKYFCLDSEIVIRHSEDICVQK